MTYDEWRNTLFVRLASVGAAFLAGVVVEAFWALDVFGVAVVAFFVALFVLAPFHLFEGWLERWYDRGPGRRERGWDGL